MTKCTNKKNLLEHDGTNQPSRSLGQLMPGYIQVNEKTLEQWATFTSLLADKLKFFNADDAYTGNWSPFFTNHIVINYARLSTWDVDGIKNFFKDNLSVLKGPFIFNPGTPQNDLITNQRKAFSAIFEGIFSTCIFIDEQLVSTTSDEYRSRLSDLVKTKLKPALARLLTYYKGGATDFIVPSGNSTQVIWGHNLANLNTLLASLKSAEWFDYTEGETTPAQYYTNRAADISVYTADTLTASTNHEVYNALNRASRHNLFTAVIDTFVYASSYVRQFCEKAFEKEVSDNGLTPHLALYFAFLHMLKEAQENINRFTERHLDFFYRQVLRLSPKPLEPNYAHLCLEIGRQLPELLLPANTKFKGGKDNTGKDVFYELERDTTFNHAKVASIKSFYQASASDNVPGIPAIFNISRAFASPVANSADGLGKEIKDDPASWHPFGNKEGKTGTAITMLMPGAEVGFALASSYLLLREGERSIQIKLFTPHVVLLNQLPFRCEVTTAKGWQLVPGVPVPGTAVAQKATNPVDGSIVFKFQLPPTFPAVEGYKETIHAASIETNFPVIRFILDDDKFDIPGKFEKIRFTEFTKCRIDISVGNWAPNANAVGAATFTGLKSLYLSNHAGALDAKKPFHPFGKPARSQNFLTIGTEELFVKPGAKFQVAVEHTDIPKDKYDIYYFKQPPRPWNPIQKASMQWGYASLHNADYTSYEYLRNGVWNSQPLGKIYNFDPFALLATDRDITKQMSLNFNSGLKPFEANSSNGFVKFNLKNDLGDDDYQSALIDYRIKQSRRVTDAREPKQPYAPCIKTICINYKVSIEIDFTRPSDASDYLSYYYIAPHGAKKLTNTISPKLALLQGAMFGLSKLSVYQPQISRVGKLVKVPPSYGVGFAIRKPIFPQFDGFDALGNPKKFISELYIGLGDTRALQRVNLLFQVLDGSTDPLVVKPDKHIYWYYLSDNEWKLFPNEKIKDYTDQLLQSGIINFEIADDATTDNTLLPKGMVWLKAAITESPGAISRLIDIKAQAALVRFTDSGNSETFLQNQLPAGSITKLLQPLAAVKKVVQPYITFGGKCVELLPAFRVRVSERLRHKDRAIQIYDYEKLILQRFPVLQKVKCLNHTRYEPGLFYNEQAPGHVTIITIPYVNLNNTADPRKPYTSTRCLGEVKQYISTKISPHVKVHVQNPVFEEIKLQFKVRLIPGVDRNYYKGLLSEELTKFLTPWAYDNGAEISFQGSIYKSLLINFIEERSYVDVLSDVKMFHRKYNDAQFSKDLDTVMGSTGSSVLVSVSPEQHTIVLM